MRSFTFHENARVKVRDVASGIKPMARSEAVTEKEQRLVRQIMYVECATAP
jgi:hypothetical protein